MHRLRPLHRTLLMMAELFLGLEKARRWECMAGPVKVIPADASEAERKRPPKRVRIRATIMNSRISEALGKGREPVRLRSVRDLRE